jgi:hypothetical protein
MRCEQKKKRRRRQRKKCKIEKSASVKKGGDSLKTKYTVVSVQECLNFVTPEAAHKFVATDLEKRSVERMVP